MEKDPTGRSAHEAGSKLDAGKNRLGLVLGDFARALWAVGEVGTFGAIKYTEHGWVEVDGGIARYTDALHRHLNKEEKGELFDEDSNLLHAAHSAWNCLARLDLILREKEQHESKDSKDPKIVCPKSEPLGSGGPPGWRGNDSLGEELQGYEATVQKTIRAKQEEAARRGPDVSE